jgi:hypothetical protein
MTAMGSNPGRGEYIFTKGFPVVFPEFVEEVRLDTTVTDGQFEKQPNWAPGPF